MAVTDLAIGRGRGRWGERAVALLSLACGWLAGTTPAKAATLPEDRADVMYHSYQGGGVTVNGPALLVRKSMADKVSVYAGYYTDMVSSASVDVVTTASKFKEKRTEVNGGIDYLSGNSLVGISTTQGHEPDYQANSLGLNVSEEFFGGMSTVTLGYTRGKDEVSKTNSTFSDHIERHQFRLGAAQVLTRRLVTSLNYEAVTEEGFLNSPYRSAIVLGAYVPERYPRTHNSHAVSWRTMYALNEEAGKPTSSIGFNARMYRDSWEIAARDVETTYTRYFGSKWVGEISYRYYSQSAASFYSDNFPAEFEFMARDKELSSFTSHSLSSKATWRFCGSAESEVRCALSLAVGRTHFSYDNFTDVRTGKLFSFDATLVNLFVSLWY